MSLQICAQSVGKKTQLSYANFKWWFSRAIIFFLKIVSLTYLNGNLLPPFVMLPVGIQLIKCAVANQPIYIKQCKDTVVPKKKANIYDLKS